METEQPEKMCNFAAIPPNSAQEAGKSLPTMPDCGERKRTAAALRESEARFQAAIGAMQEGFVLHNLAGEIVASNQSAERILGLTIDQLRGRTSLDPLWRTYYADETAFPGTMHPAQITLQRGIAQRDVIMGVDKPTGERTWISINSIPLTEEGRVSGAVVTFTDITARIEAERVLRESEARFRLLVDHLPVAFWMTTPDGRFSFVNHYWQEFTGYSETEAHRYRWQETVHPDDIEMLMQAFARQRATLQPYQTEFRLRRHDHKYRYPL